MFRTNQKMNRTDTHHEQINSKTDQQKELVYRNSPKKQKHLKKKETIEKMTEKILPQDQNEKSEHRESSGLRSQPRKDYKTLIPQSKILKKVEFKKNFHFQHIIFF